MKVSPREHHLQRVSGYSLQNCQKRSVKFLSAITRLVKVFYSVTETENKTRLLHNLQCMNELISFGAGDRRIK